MGSHPALAGGAPATLIQTPRPRAPNLKQKPAGAGPGLRRGQRGSSLRLSALATGSVKGPDANVPVAQTRVSGPNPASTRT